jgi:hypothetical protein
MRVVKIAIGALSLVLVLAACSSGHSTSNGSRQPGANTADDAAASYGHAVGAWADAVQSAVNPASDYADQIGVKHDTAQQLETQKTDCDKLRAAIPLTQQWPKLDSVPAAGSILYQQAAASAATLPARADAVRTDLQKIVRFCTWLDTFNLGESDAINANAQLFSPPLRYTDTTTVNGVKHTCPSGSSCATPDQSQWSKIAALWRQAGAATARGAQQLQHDKTPCLIDGWDAVCKLVIQEQLDYQTWADKYALAFQTYASTPLTEAVALIGFVASKFQADVLAPLQPIGGLYAKLDPAHKYSSKTSTLGVDIWVAQARQIMSTLSNDLAALNH